MEQQTSLKVYKAITYISQDPNFPFDGHDMLDAVLACYEILYDLTNDEEELLAKEIHKLATAAQTKAMVRQAIKGENLL